MHNHDLSGSIQTGLGVYYFLAALLNLRGTPIPFSVPYSQQWSFNVQRKLPMGIVIDAGYVGSKGTHLPIALNPNVATPGPGAVASRQPYPPSERSRGGSRLAPQATTGCSFPQRSGCKADFEAAVPDAASTSSKRMVES